jgi:hypothetical protein
MMGLAIGIACCALPGESRADLTVSAGYDLFQTVPSGTVFDGVHYHGVPLGTFNFGGSIGMQNTGLTDTIVQRESTVTVAAAGDTGSTQILIRGLQLESQTTVSGHELFVTLQTARSAAEVVALGAGTASTGTMNIRFNSPSGGTFATSFFDVFFDIRLDSLDGTIIGSSSTSLDSSGTTWGRTPPSGAELITGANHLLDGTDTNQDFWPSPGLHNGPHLVDPASAVPEPSTWIAWVVAGLAAPVCAQWRRRRS